MLWYLLFTLLSANSNGADYLFPENFEKRVQRHLSDSIRIEQILKLKKSTDEAFAHFARTIEQKTKKSRALYRDYSATSEQYDQVIDEMLDELVELQAQWIEARLKIASLMTSEEWRVVFSE